MTDVAARSIDELHESVDNIIVVQKTLSIQLYYLDKRKLAQQISYFCYTIPNPIFFNDFSDGDAFLATELVAALAMVDNHRHKFLDLVAEAFAVVAVEVLLVLGLVLVAHLEEAGEPPWGGDVDVALGATDDEVAFGLDANAEGEGGGGMRVVDDTLGVDVDPIGHAAVEIDVAPIGAKQLDDGHHGQRGMFGEGSSCLRCIQFTGRRSDHLAQGSLHIDDITDDAALHHGHDMAEGGAIGGLAGFEEDEVALLGDVVELEGFGLAERKGNFAQHMTAGKQAALGIVVVRKMRGGDIDGIDVGDELVEVGKGIDAMLRGKGLSLSPIGIQDGYHLCPIHHLGFGHETMGDATTADDANAIDVLALGTEHGAADAFGAGQIDDLAVFVEVVELAYPVAADGEDIDIVLLDIVDLLTEVVLDDDFVGIACGLDGLDSLEDVVAHVELAATAVEAVAGDTDDEIVAQLLGSAEEVDVSLMQEVVGAVGNDSCHMLKDKIASRKNKMLNDYIRGGIDLLK